MQLIVKTNLKKNLISIFRLVFLFQIWQLLQIPFKKEILLDGPVLTQPQFYYVYKIPPPQQKDILPPKIKIYNLHERTQSKMKNPLKMYFQTKSQQKHTSVVN